MTLVSRATDGTGQLQPESRSACPSRTARLAPRHGAGDRVTVTLGMKHCPDQTDDEPAAHHRHPQHAERRDVDTMKHDHDAVIAAPLVKAVHDADALEERQLVLETPATR